MRFTQIHSQYESADEPFCAIMTDSESVNDVTK
jgi:hypothetical protein